MSDIVKDLREGRGLTEANGRRDAWVHETMQRAADEIERLRREAETDNHNLTHLGEANAILRSRLAEAETQNRVMWDVASDREARLAEVEAEHAAFSNNVEQCEAENDALRRLLDQIETIAVNDKSGCPRCTEIVNLIHWTLRPDPAIASVQPGEAGK